MLTVKTYIALSGDKGIGLFAAEFIPKGTIWWKDDSTFNKIFLKEEYEALPPLTKEFVEHYGSLKKDGGYYLCVDNARFQNHSDSPNTCPAGGEDDYDPSQCRDWIVSRDVYPGEELTSDYRRFSLDCKDGLSFENKEFILKGRNVLKQEETQLTKETAISVNGIS